MIVTRYGDCVFSSIGITAGLLPDLAGNDVGATVLESPTPPAAYAGLLHGQRTLTLNFQAKPGYHVEYTLNRLLGLLGLGDDEPRALYGELDANDDGTPETEVSVDAVVLPNFRWAGTATVLVDFLVVQDAWRALESESVSHTTTHDTFDESMGVPVRGAARVSPIVRIRGTQARTTKTSARGWQYYKTRTVTNNGDETLRNYPWAINVGDTSALVGAGKALASGNDFRVWTDEGEVARTLDDWNTASSVAWVLLDGLAPGASRTFYFVYGNASAGTPDTLTYPDLPAFDVTISSNGTWAYLTDELSANAGLGLWWLSAGTGAPKADTDVPGAWRPWKQFDNRDDAIQRRRSTYTASGTKQHAILDAERWREGSTGYQFRGLADGVAIHHPLGITSLRCDLRYENEAIAAGGSVAAGKAVIQYRRSAADEWATIYEKSDVQATEVTVATATYSFSSPYPKHVYLGVLPNDEEEIPQEALKTAFIRLRSKTTWELNVDSSVIDAGTLSGETNGWDAYGQLNWNFGRGEYPYVQFSFGGRDDSGRLIMPTNNWLVLDAERRSAEEWDSTLTTKVRDVAGAVVAYKVDQVGSETVLFPTSDWFPTRPRRAVDIAAANLSFASGITGWTEAFNHANATVDWTTSTVAADGDSAAAKATVSANTASGPQIIDRFVNTDADGKFTVVPGQRILIQGNVHTTNVDLVPVIGLTWYDASDVAISNAYDDFTPLPAINTYYGKRMTDTAPTTAAYCRAVCAVYSTASGETGDLRFDALFVDDNIVDVSFLDVGTEVEVEWIEGWYG